MTVLKTMLAVIFGVLVIAGAAPTAGKAYTYDGGYRYTFPVSPSLSTERRMMLNHCENISGNTWVCPDAPPYTYA